MTVDLVHQKELSVLMSVAMMNACIRTHSIHVVFIESITKNVQVLIL